MCASFAEVFRQQRSHFCLNAMVSTYLLTSHSLSYHNNFAKHMLLKEKKQNKTPPSPIEYLLVWGWPEGDQGLRPLWFTAWTISRPVQLTLPCYDDGEEKDSRIKACNTNKCSNWSSLSFFPTCYRTCHTFFSCTISEKDLSRYLLIEKSFISFQPHTDQTGIIDFVLPRSFSFRKDHWYHW